MKSGIGVLPAVGSDSPTDEEDAMYENRDHAVSGNATDPLREAQVPAIEDLSYDGEEEPKPPGDDTPPTDYPGPDGEDLPAPETKDR